MRESARTAVIAAVAGIVIFVAGLSVGLFYGGHSGIRWNNELGWPPIATLVASVLNCLTVAAVAWAITTRLQQRQSNKAFERELLAGFVRSALSSAASIHEHLLHCRQQKEFGEQVRQTFIALFTGLGQEIQLIQDTLGSMGRNTPEVEPAQRCRNAYKDVLTDRDPGVPFGTEEERSAILKYSELRKILVMLMIEVNRS